MVTRVDKLAFAHRLNAACDRAGIPAKGLGRQTAVAKLFGVSQKGARKWLEGEAIPTLWRISGIALALQVTAEWLLTGRPLADDEESLKKNRAFYDLETLQLAAAIQSLPPSDRFHVRAVIKAFSQRTVTMQIDIASSKQEVTRMPDVETANKRIQPDRRTHRRRIEAARPTK